MHAFFTDCQACLTAWGGQGSIKVDVLVRAGKCQHKITVKFFVDNGKARLSIRLLCIFLKDCYGLPTLWGIRGYTKGTLKVLVRAGGSQKQGTATVV